MAFRCPLCGDRRESRTSFWAHLYGSHGVTAEQMLEECRQFHGLIDRLSQVKNSQESPQSGGGVPSGPVHSHD